MDDLVGRVPNRFWSGRSVWYAIYLPIYPNLHYEEASDSVIMLARFILSTLTCNTATDPTATAGIYSTPRP